MLNELISDCLTNGLLVAVCSYTGALSDVYRREFLSSGLVTCDTFDGLFRFQDGCPSAFGLLGFALVIIDEIGMLGVDRFDFAIRCWGLTGKKWCLVFAGDFGQSEPPSGAPSAQTSDFWDGPNSVIKKLRLQEQMRMTSAFAAMISPLRISRPDRRLLRSLVRRSRLFDHAGHWNDSCRSFFQRHPAGLLLAGRRSTVSDLNNQVLHAYFHGHTKLVPCLTATDTVEPLEVAIGCRLLVTYNCHKETGLVNGVFATLRQILSSALIVTLDSGESATIAMRPSEADLRQIGFPVLLGYACTVAKMQGFTLEAIALNLDLKTPGLAYTAISRVRNLESLWWLERPCPADFVPARRAPR